MASLSISHNKIPKIIFIGINIIKSKPGFENSRRVEKETKENIRNVDAENTEILIGSKNNKADITNDSTNTLYIR